MFVLKYFTYLDWNDLLCVVFSSSNFNLQIPTLPIGKSVTLSLKMGLSNLWVPKSSIRQLNSSHFGIKNWLQSWVGKLGINLQIFTLFSKKKISCEKSSSKEQVLQFSPPEIKMVKFYTKNSKKSIFFFQDMGF